MNKDYEMPEGIITTFGECRFCGQTMRLNTEECISKEEADEEATSGCHCPEARRYAKLKEQTSIAHEKINEYFALIDTDTTCNDYIHTAIDLVGNSKVAEVTIGANNGVKVKISSNKDGLLVIKLNIGEVI